MDEASADRLGIHKLRPCRLEGHDLGKRYDCISKNPFIEY